jgi:DNA-binding response OmpR family regulator
MSHKKTAQKILVIDDDNELRSLSVMTLQMAGYAVPGASNGKEAKDYMDFLKPDLIVLDMILPVMDGISFLHWLRHTAKLDIPVLVFTSLYKPDIESQVLEFGATDILYKPFTPDDLLERVQKLLWLSSP